MNIKKLITIRNEFGDLVNKLTEELDKYLKYGIDSYSSNINYIYDEAMESRNFIRCSGATRDKIVVDKKTNIITDIVIF
jgi:hypothetical protein